MIAITAPAARRSDVVPSAAIAYLKLFRFPFHLSFAGVVLGALMVAPGRIGELTGDLALLYFSFNVLFYGGLYTVNALADAGHDRLHPRKRERPVASGAIAPRNAALVAVSLIAAGVATELAWFGASLLPAFVVAGAFNLAYSGGLRNVAVADIVLNGATHPIRFWLGVSLAGGTCRWEWLALVFLFAVAIAALRRTIELRDVGPASRPVLRRYTPARLLAIRVLALAGVTVLWAAARPSFWIPYVVTVLAFAIFVFVAEATPRFRAAFSRLWAS